VRDLRRFEGERAGRSRRLLLVGVKVAGPTKRERTLHASLYANNRYNRYELLDYDKIASRDGYVFVSGEASLLSQTFNRDLLVSIESEGGESVYQTQAARETAQGRRSVVGLDDGHGTRRSYSGA